MKRGQIFLIASAVIVTVLVILKLNANLSEFIVSKKETSEEFERELFSNIEKEFINVVKFSSNQPNSVPENLFRFSNFTKNKLNEKMIDLNLFIVNCFIPKGSGDVNMNVSVLNFLKKDITVNLTLNTSPIQTKQKTLSVSKKWDTNFSITQGYTYLLIVSYDTHQEEILIETNEKRRYVTFFDFTFSSPYLTYRDKFSKLYSFPVTLPTTSTTTTSTTSSTTSTTSTSSTSTTSTTTTSSTTSTTSTSSTSTTSTTTTAPGGPTPL